MSRKRRRKHRRLIKINLSRKEKVKPNPRDSGWHVQRSKRILCDATQCVHRNIHTPYCDTAYLTIEYDSEAGKVVCTTYSKMTHFIKVAISKRGAAYYMVKSDKGE